MILNNIVIIIPLLLLCTSCTTSPQVKEEDKILHGGPVNDNFGVIYWSLYKDNKYQFCDGDFMEPGCYTGYYSISGDTVTLNDLKKHEGIPTNKFLIRRYKDMDSSYWQWKYPGHADDWQERRHSDSITGSTGDIFPLDAKGAIVYDRNNDFLVRLDSMENNH